MLMTPLALALAMTCAQAAPPPRTIASLQWTTVDVKPELANFYAEHLATALRDDGFKVITSAEISTLIGAERQAQLLGCSDASRSCMAELANALGAELTLLGSVAKLDETYRLHLKLLRSETGAVVNEVEVEAKKSSELLDALNRAGHRLTEPLRQTGEPGPTLRSRSWISFTGSAALLGVGAFFLFMTWGQYMTVQSDLTMPSDAATQKVKDDASMGKTFQVTGWVFVGAGVAAAALGAAMVVWGGPESATTPLVRLAPTGNGFVLTGSFW
jgi:hypothetical protein